MRQSEGRGTRTSLKPYRTGRLSLRVIDRLYADADLAALRGEGSSPLLFGRFFFVHEAQAVVTEEELRSYEFL
ncbi:hypothetical protein, partial [Streptomyces sp. WAC01526]|uniref:hypothetical protein n=1 Tax=Streptomyces sp. WAC01526 TaxID=2588709 RepID=UPI00165208ED